MKKIIFLIAVLYSASSLISCSSSQKLVKTEPGIMNQHFQVEYDRSVSSGESFRAVLTNVSDQDIYLQKPDIKQFYKMNENGWKRVHIIQCPCGAQCSPPAPFIKIVSNSSYEFAWDLWEGECVLNEDGIKVPDTNWAKSGKYRMKFYLGLDANEFIEYSFEFDVE